MGALDWPEPSGLSWVGTRKNGLPASHTSVIRFRHHVGKDSCLHQGSSKIELPAQSFLSSYKSQAFRSSWCSGWRYSTVSASVYHLHSNLLFLIRSSVHSTASDRKKKEGREEGKGRQKDKEREETGRVERGRERNRYALILDLPWWLQGMR